MKAKRKPPAANPATERNELIADRLNEANACLETAGALAAQVVGHGDPATTSFAHGAEIVIQRARGLIEEVTFLIERDQQRTATA